MMPDLPNLHIFPPKSDKWANFESSILFPINPSYWLSLPRSLNISNLELHLFDWCGTNRYFIDLNMSEDISDADSDSWNVQTLI